MGAPSLSVIIPVHNAGDRLGSAIESIHAQRYPGPLQIVVVDDGSTDDTPAVIAALGDTIVSVRQRNAGPSSARNTGLALADGALLSFLDADDQWPTDKLALQVGALTEDPHLDVVLGRISYVEGPGGQIPEMAYEDEQIRSISNVHLGSGVYRRSSFDRVGGFDPSLRFSEDHDWFLRARELGLTIRILDHVTLLYLLHDKNMTRERPATDMSITTVLKQSLDRRRRLMGRADELPRWRAHDDRYRDELT
jgi:glycosyltransferase involved in cell wall biosynthesis